MGNITSQSFFIPKPPLTEHNLPDQTGKVFIVTGGYAGCGLGLARILYGKNGVVYVAGRSKEKGDQAISSIKESYPNSRGRCEFLEIDLSDFNAIKTAVEAFTAKEDRLDVLTNNAGVMFVPPDSKDKQGNELHIGTNCLGPFLLTKLLQPIMLKTASSPGQAPGSVRVTWGGSMATDTIAPKGGVALDSQGSHAPSRDKGINYGMSKAGNRFIASEAARRYPDSGILHLCWNPGNLDTDLYRHTHWIMAKIAQLTFLHPPILGSYTELWAGWSADVKLEDNGGYVWPWGRFGPNRKDITASMLSTDEGGTGVAAKFWDYCDAKTKDFS